jgi:hypothetical protein
MNAGSINDWSPSRAAHFSRGGRTPAKEDHPLEPAPEVRRPDVL